MNILLLVVGIIFLICVIVGYRKGFLKLALSLGVTIAAMILVTILSPHVSTWIQKSTPLSEKVQSKIEKVLLAGVQTEENLTHVEESQDEQIALIERGNIPEVLRDGLLSNNNGEVYEMLGVTSFVEYIGAYVSKVVADVIAFLVTLLAMLIIVRIVMGLIGVLGRIPIVGGVNRIAGAILGMGFGIIIVWILFIVVTLLYNTDIGTACLQNIAESQILTELYNRNILMNFITNF